MNKYDRIISELVDALHLISREADKEDASRHYIAGVASQAIKNCDRSRERNSDGYLVVKGGR